MDEQTPVSALSGDQAASALNNYLETPQGTFAADFDRAVDLIMNERDYNNAWSAQQADEQRFWSAQEAEKVRQFNSDEALKNRQWQEYMSNTAHQREVQDLFAAGLNPILSASGGNGAPVTSGSAASASNPSGSQANGDQSTGMAIASILGTVLNNQTKLEEQRLNAELNRELTEKQMALNEMLSIMSNETSRANAAQAAGASMYAASQAANASMYAASKNYDSTMYGIVQRELNNASQRNWQSEENEAQRNWQSGENQLSRIFDEYIKRTYPSTEAGIISSVGKGLSEVADGVSSTWQSWMKYLDEQSIIGNLFNDFGHAFLGTG